MANLTWWPFAVQQAVWIYNHVPRVDQSISTYEQWSRSKVSLTELRQLHVFGCPVYVLDKKIADGKKLPRCIKSSRLGVEPPTSVELPTSAELPVKQQSTSAPSPIPSTTPSYKDAVLTKPISRVQNLQVVEPLRKTTPTKPISHVRAVTPVQTQSSNVLPAI